MKYSYMRRSFKSLKDPLRLLCFFRLGFQINALRVGPSSLIRVQHSVIRSPVVPQICSSFQNIAKNSQVSLKHTQVSEEMWMLQILLDVLIIICASSLWTLYFLDVNFCRHHGRILAKKATVKSNIKIRSAPAVCQNSHPFVSLSEFGNCKKYNKNSKHLMEF